MISTAHTMKSTMMKQHHIFPSTSLLHRIVPIMSSTSCCSSSFLSRTTMTTIILILMIMLSFPTIALSLDDNGGVEIKNNQGINILQKNNSMQQEHTTTIHTNSELNERKHEDQQEGMNHLNNIMTKDVPVVHRKTQENCVSTEESLRSAVNSAKSRSSYTATVITLCSELIYINAQINIYRKNIQLNCFSDMCTLDARNASRHFSILDANIIFNRINFINGNYTGINSRGGSIYFDYVTAIFNGCNFLHNVAKEDGGAIFSTHSKINMVNITMLDNRGGFWGGAVSSINDDYYIINSIISRNGLNVNISTGGAFKFLSSDVIIENTNITNNKADSVAGAVWFSTGTLVIRNSIVSENTANVNGTFLVSSNSNITITDTLIYNNFPENLDTGKTVCEIYQYRCVINEIKVEGEGGCYFLPALPSQQPSVSAMPSASVMPSARPSTKPSTKPSTTISTQFKWVLVNASLDISRIKMDQIFNFTTIGTNLLSVRLETPYTNGQVVYRWLNIDGRASSARTRLRKTIPFVLQIPYLSSVGIKKLNATMTSTTGALIGTSTIRFNMTK